MSKTFASTYQYDPLDRLSNANTVQRFYNTTRIATEIEGARKSRFFRPTHNRWQCSNTALNPVLPC